MKGAQEPRRGRKRIQQRPGTRRFLNERNSSNTQSGAAQFTAFRAWLTKDGWAIIGILVLIPIGLYLVFIQPDRYTVNEITISETEFVDRSTIESVIDGELQKNLLGLPRENYWLVRTERMKRRIQKELESVIALESVEVTKERPNRLIVQVNERIPSMTWVTTRIGGGQEYFYSVDRTGRVTQELGSFADVNPALPRIRDDNREQLGIDWHIIGEAYIEDILYLDEYFTTQTGLELDHYILPAISCSERQYRAERIFEQEILESESDEFKERKRLIQEQFRNGQLDIDQSLEALEQVKNEELSRLQEQDDSNAFTRIEWEAIAVEVECDYVQVATDITVQLTEASGGYQVRMDTTQDLNTQMENILTIIQQSDIDGIEYIDVRITDRAYIK